MKRRDFIKNSICIGCLGALTSGRSSEFFYNGNIKNDKFYYGSDKELPRGIRLEACSLCQLNCPACDTRMIEKHAPKDWLGCLKFDDFKKFIDDNKYIREIELSHKGEIFLNPELDMIIDYAFKKNIMLSANNGTNLNTVSEKTLENLVKYKFRLLKVSIDGATPETYKIYRRGGDFNKVIDNIKKINYFKKKYNSEFPKLTWQFILFGHNEHEIELAKEKAHQLNMEIEFRCNNVSSYSPVKNNEAVKRKTGINSYIKSAKDISCRKLFRKPQIDYDGTLLGCCFIHNKNFKVNVFKNGLLNALNSARFLYAKHILTDFSTPLRKDIPCYNCPDYEFIKKYNYKII